MKYFVVDTFTDSVFTGNPAGVCLLEKPLDADLMQSIASENNLAETAFVLPRGKDFDLRWFTPTIEIDLCGHATLASAFIIMNFIGPVRDMVRFNTASGVLSVEKKGDLYVLDFPARPPLPTEVTPLIEQAMPGRILEAHSARDLLLLVETEEAVRRVEPDMQLLRQITDCFAVIITAQGQSVDFVSRFFAPNAGIPEDPVTGSSHATLIPFWAARLHKQELVAKQLSRRGGTLLCENCGNRVKIAGKAVLYLGGELHV